MTPDMKGILEHAMAPSNCHVCDEPLIGVSVHFVYDNDEPWATYYPCGCTLDVKGNATCVAVGAEYHRPRDAKGGLN